MDRSAFLRRNFEYAGLHGTYWMVYCVAVSYAGVFLLANSYTNAEIGSILAAGYLLSVVLQPLVAGLADRSRRVSPVGFLALIALAATAGAACLLVWRGHSLPLTVSFVLFLTAELVLQPLVNAFAFYLERLQTPIAFGITRSCGSLSYAVLSVILGALVLRRGVTVLPVAALLCLGLMFVLLLLFRREGPALVPPPAAQKGEALTLSALFSRCRSFLFLLLGTALLFFGHSLINNFIIQIVTNVGGTSAQMGTLCSYAALMELPAMLLFDRLHRKFTCVQLLRFAAVFFILKITLTLLASSVAMLFLAQTLQALSFALLIPASVRYADETMPAQDANKAQALLTVAITVGNIFSSMVGGVLIDRIAVRGALTVGLAVTVAGTLTVLLGIRPGAQKAAQPR